MAELKISDMSCMCLNHGQPETSFHFLYLADWLLSHGSKCECLSADFTDHVHKIVQTWNSGVSEATTKSNTEGLMFRILLQLEARWLRSTRWRAPSVRNSRTMLPMHIHLSGQFLSNSSKLKKTCSSFHSGVFYQYAQPSNSGKWSIHVELLQKLLWFSKH